MKTVADFRAFLNSRGKGSDWADTQLAQALRIVGKQLARTDADNTPGRMMIEEEKFLRVWHDEDADGNKYRNFGIAVGPPARIAPEPVRKSYAPDAEDDPVAQAELMADILGGLFGDDALAMLDQVQKRHSVRISKVYNEIDHPRGPNGRWIPKGSAEAVAKAKQGVDEIRKLGAGARTPQHAQKLAEHLSILTVKQLHELKKEYGLKASGNREALVAKLLDRLPGAQERIDQERKAAAEKLGLPEEATLSDIVERVALDAGYPEHFLTRGELTEKLDELGISTPVQRGEAMQEAFRALKEGIKPKEAEKKPEPQPQAQAKPEQKPQADPSSSVANALRGADRAAFDDYSQMVIEQALRPNATIAERLSALGGIDTALLDELDSTGAARRAGIGHNEFFRSLDKDWQEYDSSAKTAADAKKLLDSLENEKTRITDQLVPGLRKLAAEGVEAHGVTGETIDLDKAADFYQKYGLASIDAIANAVKGGKENAPSESTDPRRVTPQELRDRAGGKLDLEAIGKLNRDIRDLDMERTMGGINADPRLNHKIDELKNERDKLAGVKPGESVSEFEMQQLTQKPTKKPAGEKPKESLKNPPSPGQNLLTSPMQETTMAPSGGNEPPQPKKEEPKMNERAIKLSSLYQRKYPSLTADEANELAAKVADKREGSDEAIQAAHDALAKARQIHMERTLPRPELPELQGTDKQKQFAETVRQQQVKNVLRQIERAEDALSNARQDRQATPERLERFEAAKTSLVERLSRISKITKAGWWLDHKHNDLGTVSDSIFDMLAKKGGA